jgi:hypothetical protein
MNDMMKNAILWVVMPCVISQKIAFFIATAVETSDLTFMI